MIKAFVTSAFKPDKPVAVLGVVDDHYYLVWDGEKRYAVPEDQLYFARELTLDDLL